MIAQALTTAQLQGWIGIVGGLLTAILGLVKYFNFRSRRDTLNAVGQAFESVVDAIASQEAAKRLSGAILLRRFFDAHTEQGERGTPYAEEAVAVIAALLRDTEAGNFQKLLADGLRYAPSLVGADLQHCNLQQAYLGSRSPQDPTVDLTGVDFFEADLSSASLRHARAPGAVFYGAILRGTVFEGCDLTAGDFRQADLQGARFANAVLVNARFDGAKNLPAEIAALVDEPDERNSVQRSDR